MKIVLWVTILLMISFPFYSSPISLGSILILTSFGVVTMISLNSSWWYSYILFLVYIGGLLVMFIYVCLISSNYPFVVSLNHYISMLSGSFLISYLLSMKPMPKSFLGASIWDSGADLIVSQFLWLFGGLVVLLLIMLLVVVRSSGAGAVKVN